MLDIQIESVQSSLCFVMAVAFIFGPCDIDCAMSSASTFKASVGKALDARRKYSDRGQLQPKEGRSARFLPEEISDRILYDSSVYRDDDYINNVPGNDKDGSSAINDYSSAFGNPGYHTRSNGSHNSVPKTGYGRHPTSDSQQPIAPPPQYPVDPYGFSNLGPPDAANAMIFMQRLGMGYGGGHGWGQVGRSYVGGEVGGWGRPKRSPHYGGGWYNPRPPPPIAVIKEREGGYLDVIPIIGLVSLLALLGTNMMNSGTTTILSVTGPPGLPGPPGAIGLPGLPGINATITAGSGKRRKRSLIGQEIDFKDEVTYVSPQRISLIHSSAPPIAAKTNNSEVEF